MELNAVCAGMVDDPAHYRRSSYRHNASGQGNRCFVPRPLYLALGNREATTQTVCRWLFRAELGQEAISDIGMAVNQNQPLGNSRSYAKIEAMTGRWWELKPRGRHGKKRHESPGHDAG
jgi:putative transposase